jgi:hypothetical protein
MVVAELSRTSHETVSVDAKSHQEAKCLQWEVIRYQRGISALPETPRMLSLLGHENEWIHLPYSSCNDAAQ